MTSVPATSEVLVHPSMSGDLSDPNNGASALKHLVQQASILGHMEGSGLLGPTCPASCYVEFGAGRAKLTGCIHKAVLSSSDKASVALWHAVPVPATYTPTHTHRHTHTHHTHTHNTPHTIHHTHTHNTLRTHTLHTHTLHATHTLTTHHTHTTHTLHTQCTHTHSHTLITH